ncbi:MAG TPA: WYL domain-containing protein [Gammaproteobacteria bacterium]|nr:WYL domain-containing protein [Gammaproteobacteria bacterium]
MASSGKTLADIKWNTRQRLQYIELMAYYTGIVTRSDIARAFGISDAAATKDLKLYGDLAPDNLVYKHNVFGFIPGISFKELFNELSAEKVLKIIAENTPVTGSPIEKNLIFGVSVEALPLPLRLPSKPILAQIIRALKNHKKLEIVYRSLSERESDERRIIEPHSLANTGLRWHARAYSVDTFDFRDFVLSRITKARVSDEQAESSSMYDDDWVEIVTIHLAPHPGLSGKQRLGLLTDYKASDDLIQIEVKRSLVGYLLQRLSVDTTADHSLNPGAYQLVVANRDEIEPFAGWAFL